MNIELLKEGIKEARAKIAEEKAFISESEQEVAEYLCPFAIGDKVLSPKGKKEIVASISYCSWSRAGYEIKVFKIKKDGKPYKQSTYAFGDYEKYVKAT